MTVPTPQLANSGSRSLTRRRFLAISATAAAIGVLPVRVRAQDVASYTWRGVALGAEASLTLQHPDEAKAKGAIAACLAEVERLERIFSLYRSDSALVQLNRDGRLDAAPADLRRLVSEAITLASETGGAFDPTVEPLWQLYRTHFQTPDADPEGPSHASIEAARARTGWRDVEIRGGGAIVLTRPGMALTLNGIAQGYITDQAALILQELGFVNVLIDLGEQRALGPKSDGQAWRAGIRDPFKVGGVIAHAELSAMAMATSAASGLTFDALHRFPHILDARSGGPARSWASVSVLAERAALADGLSTALAVLPPEAAADLLRGRARAIAVPAAGGPPVWI